MNENFVIELIEILTGKISLATYAAALIFSCLGFTMAAIIDYINRKIKTIPFNLIYWFKRNGAFLLLLFPATYTFLRWQEDLIVGITQQTGDSLSFIKDKFLWFLIGGLLFRVLFHYGSKWIKKLRS